MSYTRKTPYERDSLKPYSDAPTSMKTSPLARLRAGQSLSVISSDATSMPNPPMQMKIPCVRAIMGKHKERKFRSVQRTRSCVQWYFGRMYIQQKRRQTGIAHASRSIHDSSVVYWYAFTTKKLPSTSHAARMKSVCTAGNQRGAGNAIGSCGRTLPSVPENHLQPSYEAICPSRSTFQRVES